MFLKPALKYADEFRFGYVVQMGKRGSVVDGLSPMLQAGRSQVLVPMKALNVFKLPNPSSHTMPLEFTRHLTEMIFLGVKRGRRVSLTTSLASVSRLSRECGILDVSHPYRRPLPVRGIALLFCILFKYNYNFMTI
jgi:hypothetical protein